MTAKTKWEKIGENILEKSKLQEKLEKELLGIKKEIENNAIENKDFADLLKARKELEEKIEILSNEIVTLKEVQDKLELDHLSSKIQECDDEIKKIQTAFEPTKKAYQKAKLDFEKAKNVLVAEKEATQSKIDDVFHQREALKQRITYLNYQASIN
ncbi:MAG: hypothetical protein JJT76_17550 [Clostridiaceae bacterium]|nr:hypothetical protein [Clostridiaceae bacterium]